MRRVIVESPFAGRTIAWSSLDVGSEDRATFIRAQDAQLNLSYTKALCRHIARRGEAPYASHIFATQFLDDTDPLERMCGIELGLAWGSLAHVTIVGVDRGVSRGMVSGIERAQQEGRKIEFLSLPEWADSFLPESVDRTEWLRYNRCTP